MITACYVFYFLEVNQIAEIVLSLIFALVILSRFAFVLYKLGNENSDRKIKVRDKVYP
jgi:hypothetical protein